MSDPKTGKITAHFSVREFKCRDGTDVPDKYSANLQALVMVLERIRREFGKPMKIISGYRTPAYNKKVSGSSRSKHMVCQAADFVIDGVTPGDIAIKVQELQDSGEILVGGCGLYPGRFVHVDVRGTKARWEG